MQNNNDNSRNKLITIAEDADTDDPGVKTELKLEKKNDGKDNNHNEEKKYNIEKKDENEAKSDLPQICVHVRNMNLIIPVSYFFVVVGVVSCKQSGKGDIDTKKETISRNYNQNDHLFLDIMWYQECLICIMKHWADSRTFSIQSAGLCIFNFCLSAFHSLTVAQKLSHVRDAQCLNRENELL